MATSQRRDYQLRLDVTGLLPNPVIAMTSTPALDATDVLLMVMTGRPPTEDTPTSRPCSGSPSLFRSLSRPPVCSKDFFSASAGTVWKFPPGEEDFRRKDGKPTS